MKGIINELFALSKCNVFRIYSFNICNIFSKRGKTKMDCHWNFCHNFQIKFCQVAYRFTHHTLLIIFDRNNTISRSAGSNSFKNRFYGGKRKIIADGTKSILCCLVCKAPLRAEVCHTFWQLVIPAHCENL